MENCILVYFSYGMEGALVKAIYLGGWRAEKWTNLCQVGNQSYSPPFAVDFDETVAKPSVKESTDEQHHHNQKRPGLYG